MRKAAALALALVFTACMIHFFYGEDHCPVHCPSKGGRFGHVHHHHTGASVCLCFWASLFGPETSDVLEAMGLISVMAPLEADHPLTSPAADIAHPPRSVLV